MTDRDLKDLIDVEGIDSGEEARLRRVHNLLLEAGPPAELPPKLLAPGEPPSAEILQFPSLPPRRWAATFVVAAAFVLAAFGGGYLFGHSKAKPARFATARVVDMHALKSGVAGFAVLRVSHSDAVGNWPMEMTVSGLPQQPQRTAYYELWLTRHGQPTLPCGTFRVHAKSTTVRFTVPYVLKGGDGWVVTAHAPGEPEPGRIVLTT